MKGQGFIVYYRGERIAGLKEVDGVVVPVFDLEENSFSKPEEVANFKEHLGAEHITVIPI